MAWGWKPGYSVTTKNLFILWESVASPTGFDHGANPFHVADGHFCVQRKNEILVLHGIHVGEIGPASAEDGIAIIAVVHLIRFDLVLAELFLEFHPVFHQYRAKPRRMFAILVPGAHQGDTRYPC